jgi:hypothetical protein
MNTETWSSAILALGKGGLDARLVKRLREEYRRELSLPVMCATHWIASAALPNTGLPCSSVST